VAHLGAKIRALRIEKQLTLPALADRSGLSKGLLSKIETDETSNPSISTLFKIAEGLETTVAAILETERAAIKSPPITENNEWQKKLVSFLRTQDKEPDPHILSAMQLLRNRKAIKSDDLEHWKFLYTSIENSFKK
jgi:transcriptional regulator with XRE-family HTH domain